MIVCAASFAIVQIATAVVVLGLVAFTLELQESALTGESAPIPKDAGTLPGGEVALGDRTNLVFQNTQATRGTSTFVVTGTGSATEMGRIAGMVTATKRTRSPR